MGIPQDSIPGALLWKFMYNNVLGFMTGFYTDNLSMFPDGFEMALILLKPFRSHYSVQSFSVVKLLLLLLKVFLGNRCLFPDPYGQSVTCFNQGS